MPSWGGSKFALSTFLARRVRAMMCDEATGRVLPGRCARMAGDPARPLGHSVRRTKCCSRPSRAAHRHFLVCYPFEGRLAHTTLAMLLTRRLERAGRRTRWVRVQRLRPGGLGARAPWTISTWPTSSPRTCWATILKSWLAESTMMKARLQGLRPDRRPDRASVPGGEEIRAPDHLFHRPHLRRPAPPPARSPPAALRPRRRRPGPASTWRVWASCWRASGAASAMSPWITSRPSRCSVILEIGRQRSPGEGTGEMILMDAAEDLIAEAVA